MRWFSRVCSRHLQRRWASWHNNLQPLSGHRRPNRRSFIRLPNGTTRLARLTGEYWRSLAPVREYRLLQYADGEIQAFVTTERSLLATELHALENRLLSRLHPDIKVRITPLARIEWEARWKRLDVLRLDRLRGDAL